MGAWGLPALNTIILLTSGGRSRSRTWALKNNERGKLSRLAVRHVLLGFIFLYFQAWSTSTPTRI